MSDLEADEEDLLALAGAGSDSGNESQDYEPELATSEKRKKSASGSSKRIKVSDDEDGDEDEDGKPDDDYQVEEDDEDDDDEEQEGDLYPLEGKYKNEEDRAELMAMDEVTRESILFDRLQEIEKSRERKYLALRAKQNQLEKNRIHSEGTKTDKRLKTSKLSELKKQREKKSRRLSRDDFEDDEEEEGEPEEEEEDEYGRYGDEYDEYGRSDEEAYGGEERKKMREMVKENLKEAGLTALNTIRMGRSQLAKFSWYPQSESVVPGTYGRVNVGVVKGKPQYRMVRLEGIKHGKVYPLQGKSSNVYLEVSQGKDTKVIAMTYFSDSPITPEEFARYRQRVEEARHSWPTIGEAKEKYEELKQMSSKPLTDDEINQMMKKKSTVLPMAMEKEDRVLKMTNLREKLAVAISNEDTELVNVLTKELKQLEGIASEPTTQESSAMSKVNERNTKLNNEGIRRAEMLAVEKRKQELLSSAKSADPFSRLRTTTRIYYSSDESKKPGVVKDEDAPAESQIKIHLDETKKLSTDHKGLAFDDLVKRVEFDLPIEI